MKSTSKKYDEILINIDELNKQCVDCQNKSVTHVSINNGVILCESCALQHQSFGNSISYVRKMNDEWDEFLFNHLIFGSNTKFTKFLQAYSIDSSMSLESKYFSNASEYYRKTLRNKILGQPPELEPLDPLIAKEPCGLISLKSEFDDYQIETKERKTALGKMTGFFGSMGKKIGKSAWEEMKKAGNFVAEKTAPATDKLMQGANYVADKVAPATEKIKQGANYVADKVAPATEKIKQGANFVASHAKNAYVDVKGIIIKKTENENEEHAIEVNINDNDIPQQEQDQNKLNNNNDVNLDKEKLDDNDNKPKEITENIDIAPSTIIEQQSKSIDKPGELLIQKIENNSEEESKSDDKTRES